MKKKSAKSRDNKLDTLWALAVKARAGNKCEYCGRTEVLNSHHIFSRSNKKLRWDLSNGVCLCVFHHVFGNFSAHKSPLEFAEWLRNTRGNDWYDNLRRIAKNTDKYIPLSDEDTQTLVEELKGVRQQNS
jgi:hypothetical protein